MYTFDKFQKKLLIYSYKNIPFFDKVFSWSLKFVILKSFKCNNSILFFLKKLSVKHFTSKMKGKYVSSVYNETLKGIFFLITKYCIIEQVRIVKTPVRFWTPWKWRSVLLFANDGTSTVRSSFKFSCELTVTFCFSFSLKFPSETYR